MQKRVIFLIRLLVTVSIFFAFFKFIPYQKIIELYADADKFLLILAFLVFWLSLIVAVARWRFLLLVLKIKATFREIIYSYFSGLFLNLFFPSLVAGDLFRAYSISSRHSRKEEVISSILMDRFSGIVALTLIALAGFSFLEHPFKHQDVLLCLLVLFLAVIFLLFIIFSRSFFKFFFRIFKKRTLFYQKLLSLHRQLYFFREKPFIFCRVLIYSLIIQFLVPIGFFLASLAFGLSLHPIIFFAVIPIVMVAAFIPLTIAGAGTREALTVYFLSGYGVASSVSLGIALVNLIYTVTAGILGGVAYVAVYHRWLQPGSQNREPKKI